jgi:hypothetical protein
MQIAFAPNDLPAANSKPERHPSGSARSAVPRLRPGYRDRDHFGTFVTDCLDLDGVSARSRVLVAPIRAKTVVSPIGIYPLRRAVELGHPRAAGIPAGKPAFEVPIVPGRQRLAHDLHVLLRHRPLSISRAASTQPAAEVLAFEQLQDAFRVLPDLADVAEACAGLSPKEWEYRRCVERISASGVLRSITRLRRSSKPSTRFSTRVLARKQADRSHRAPETATSGSHRAG